MFKIHIEGALQRLLGNGEPSGIRTQDQGLKVPCFRPAKLTVQVLFPGVLTPFGAFCVDLILSHMSLLLVDLEAVQRPDRNDLDAIFFHGGAARSRTRMRSAAAAADKRRVRPGSDLDLWRCRPESNRVPEGPMDLQSMALPSRPGTIT